MDLTWTQLALLQLLTTYDTSRARISPTDGTDDEVEVNLGGTVRLTQAELKALTAQDWVEIHPETAEITVLNDGAVAMGKTCNKLSETPEGCSLVAYDTGEGWCLSVEDAAHDTVAMLEWPKRWPKAVSAKYLREVGFTVV